MPKTEGYKDFLKQREAHNNLEPVDYDEKRYSFKDMQCGEDIAAKEMLFLGIFFIVMFVFSVLTLSKH